MSWTTSFACSAEMPAIRRREAFAMCAVAGKAHAQLDQGPRKHHERGARNDMKPLFWIILALVLIAAVAAVVLFLRARKASGLQAQRDKARDLRERAEADRIEVQRREAEAAKIDAQARMAQAEADARAADA